METGKLIKELRIKKGMTQEELADKTEVSARTIQRIENGEVDPRAYTLQMIAKALEVDFSLFTQNESNEGDDLKNDSNRNWLALIHLSGILPLILPTILIWNRKKSEVKEISDHFRASISFQLTILFICAISLFGFHWNERLEINIGILIASVFFSVKNAVRVLNGKSYRYFGIFGVNRENK
jgi:transcriptional regulator with XRE-family HTH domain